MQPSLCNKCYQRTAEFCPSLVSGGADFIYYEPWCRCVLSESEGIRLVNRPRHNIQDGHPTGWLFDTVPDGWEPGAQAVADRRDGWDEDIPTDEDIDHRTCKTVHLNTERIICRQGNMVYVKGVDEHEENSLVCDLRESVADVVRTFLTQVWFSKEYLGSSWAKIRGYIRALLRLELNVLQSYELSLHFSCYFSLSSL